MTFLPQSPLRVSVGTDFFPRRSAFAAGITNENILSRMSLNKLPFLTVKEFYQYMDYYRISFVLYPEGMRAVLDPFVLQKYIIVFSKEKTFIHA